MYSTSNFTYHYATESREEIIESFYEQLQSIINDLPTNETLIAQGDMTAKVGQTTAMDQQFKDVIERFGLCIRKEPGERMLQCCQEHNLTVTTTLFHHHARIALQVNFSVIYEVCSSS